ncbi:beta-galactosidase [Leptospira ryugenii]|uniref:Beta-glucosidase n=1 Tax=Leptospira ryugenii TaxID=1917863 RepID=A0A2P2E0R6_9LEPT|nr:GH1 family beta-glucosidase [Leptospira ryugenii]GBF50485.1 beta-galactosidase [Leptospira ryugenii]
MIQLTFPKGFVWGTATSSYQIEGAFNEDGKGLSNWDVFTKKKGKIKNGEHGDIACDHYHKYKEDITLMRRLNIASYRFSISWPRVMPSGVGYVNEKGLDFYERLVDELLKQNIQPFVTLYHWDLPQSLEEKGGWLNRETAYHFADYTEVIVKRLGDRVKHWITLNEPWIVMFAGYIYGAHAPGKRKPFSAFKVAHNLLLAHGLSLSRIRNLSPKSKVGLTNALSPVYSYRLDKETKAVKRANALMNQLWLDPIYKGVYPEILRSEVESHNKGNLKDGDMELISKPSDFLGVNHYSRMIVKPFPIPLFRFLPILPKSPKAEFTTMGWEIYPEGFYDLLAWIQKEYKNPNVYITENGISLDDQLANGKVMDPTRIRYMKDYLLSVLRAIEGGANVKGYFVWSFLDNFEWQEGYAKKFGIVYVDRKDPNLQRTPKESARWYAKVCKDNGFQF